MEGYRCFRCFIPLAIVIVSLIVSCKTTNLSSIGSGEKPFQVEKDEKKVWQYAEQLERLLDQRGLIYKDPSLEAFLETMAKRLTAQNFDNQAPTPRIKVIKDPYLNAFALPHGVIYIHIGILARMENENQLAAILSHELVHFTCRHTIKEIRKAQNQEALFRVLQAMLVVPIGSTGGSIIGGSLTDLTNRAGATWALSTISGYSRELETEADTEGFRLMAGAGYDPGEAVKVFEILQRDIDEAKVKEPFLYGTHPHIQGRIENYRRLLATSPKTQTREERPFKNTDEFLVKIEPVMLENANLNLQIGRVKVAQTEIEKFLQRRPDCGRAYFLLGEVYRHSEKNQEHIEWAVSAYYEAVRLSPLDPLPYRELGLLYRARNRREEARSAFEQYLILSPKAADASIVRGYLTELNKP